MKRISKAAARKLYNAGEPFWITAVNMRPEYGIYFDNKTCRKSSDFANFDAMANAFAHYNCGGESGRYPAYYVG